MAAITDLAALPYAPYLQPHTGELERGEHYSEIHLDGTDLDEPQATGARFSESALTGLTATNATLTRARLDDVWISRTRWIGGTWSETQMLNVTVLDSVLAGLQAYGSTWRRVTFQACKIDSLNLRGSTLHDVEFRDCDLTEADFGDATLTGVTFPGTTIRRARFSKATLKKVDLRGARDLDIAQGWDSLHGATITGIQLMESAHALAQTLGITVKD
ncbi:MULTISPECIES: pentapeptide repeat-containing protein [Actinoplanes]|uniref:pentapeptide repeat-containing protein n=1 Tax=Actinoplanes TaxID=1865 RepID=UPI0005F2BA65|nr:MULTISPECIES: pentapeptide repeat-containing protein [Actinoplanes]GLY03011.1 hypothetical protein Acsp01_33900 [Actinoplanes sp. NBRC 101535]